MDSYAGFLELHIETVSASITTNYLASSNRLVQSLLWFLWYVVCCVIDLHIFLALPRTITYLISNLGILTWINSLFVIVHLENIYFNALLFSFSNLPGNLLSAFLMDRTGRKNMLVVSTLSAAFSLLIFAYFASDKEDSLNTTGIVASACLFQAFSMLASPC